LLDVISFILDAQTLIYECAIVLYNSLINFVIFFSLEKQNIVHLDIKPDNLLITRHGTVKIGDFSVSQAFEVM